MLQNIIFRIIFTNILYSILLNNSFQVILAFFDLFLFLFQVLEKLKANQRRDYLKGTVSGSVQATDRLMKELRDIYRSPSFKSGAYQVIDYIISFFKMNI